MLTKAISPSRTLSPIAIPVENFSMPDRSRPFAVIWLAIAMLIAAYANFNYLWNQYYRRTPVLFDTAWYAHLIHRSSPMLQNPPTVTFDTIGPDFYATHFSPLLWVFSWPTYLLPVSPEVWLACVEAAKYALLALVTWLALRSAIRDAPPLSGAQKAAAIAIVFLAPFNGIALASIAYPHFEGWFMVGALGFLFALFRGRTGVAAILFLATLMLREDMGFHLCGLLVMAAAGAFVMRRKWDREITRWSLFAGAGFVWSGAAIALMKLRFPGDDAFNRVYVGTPPWAHLTGLELWNRVLAHLETRANFWLPLAVFVVWAITRRRWWVVLGYAAFVPWVAVNFIARSQAAATLALYYSFPLGVALLWPLVAHSVFGRPGERFGFGWLAAALALSIAGFIPTYMAPPRFEWEDMLYPTTRTRAVLESTTQTLASVARNGEAVTIDDAVAALAPAAFTAKNLLGQGQQDVSIAAFFSSGRSQQIARETIFRLALPFNYRVRGTAMVLVAAKPLDWPQLELASSRPGSISLMLQGENPDLTWNGRAPNTPALRPVGESPKLYFTAGPATATFVVSVARGEASTDSALICEVITGLQGERTLASTLIPLAELSPSPATIERTLNFSVPFDQGAGVQLRVRAPAGSTGRIEDFVLITSPPAPPPGETAPKEP
jgi:hypothetical protein